MNVEIMKKLGEGVSDIVKLYVKDASSEFKDLIDVHIRSLDAIRTKVLTADEMVQFQAELDADMRSFKTRIDAFLVEAAGLLVKYPSAKAFKQIDSLIRILNNLG